MRGRGVGDGGGGGWCFFSKLFCLSSEKVSTLIGENLQFMCRRKSRMSQMFILDQTQNN